jgi:hypothetical protein
MLDGPELKGEDKLNNLFANKVMYPLEFRNWLLSHTKFENRIDHVRILEESEYMIRPRRFWWRHWWCYTDMPECSGKETDIFLVFEGIVDKKRFALHVENKLRNSKFEILQAACYAARGKHMINRPEFLLYSDFETMLIAPLGFRCRHKELADPFDRYVSHEEIAPFIAEFGS